MTWNKVKIGSFLKERIGRFKPAEANKMGLRRIEKIDFSGTYHLVEKPTNTDMILVKKGDLLISGINAEKGAVTVYDENDDALATIHYSSYEFDKNKIDVEYFRWFLISDAFKNLLKANAGGGIKTELKSKHLLPLEIYLPKLDIQTEIVKIIKQRHKKVIHLQDFIEQQETHLQQLRQSILQEAVQGKLVAQDPADEPAEQLLQRIKAQKQQLIKEGKLKKDKELPSVTADEIPFELPKGWVWCRLGEISLSSEAGKSHKCSERGVTGSEWGIIKMSAISSGEFKQDENKHFKPAFDDKDGLKIKAGDLLFARASGSRNLTGVCCQVKDISKNLLLNDKTIRFRFPNYMSVDFISILNNSLYGRAYYERIMGSKTTTMNNITREQFKDLQLPLPPLPEVQRIVAKVEQLMQIVKKLEEQVQQSKEEAGQLLQAVLKEAFSPPLATKAKLYEENEVVMMVAEE